MQTAIKRAVKCPIFREDIGGNQDNAFHALAISTALDEVVYKIRNKN